MAQSSLSPEQQRAYLQRMGIPLWTRRTTAQQAQTASTEEEAAANPSVIAEPVSQFTTAPTVSNAPAVDDGMESPPAWFMEAAPLDLGGAPPEAEDAPPLDFALDHSLLEEAKPKIPPVSSLDWEGLRERISACELCSLHKTRTQTVFGVGSQQAQLMLVGEAPGREEDRKGEPFVGRAGQLLTAMLLALGLRREDVYIANILKCRPPENRDPDHSETAACTPYLARQIELVQPKLILALGRFAAQYLLDTQQSISKLRGETHTYLNTPLIVTYHPAYLLRNPNDKARSWEDLQAAWHLWQSLK